MAHLVGACEERIAADDQITENFVASELIKHAEWAARVPSRRRPVHA